MLPCAALPIPASACTPLPGLLQHPLQGCKAKQSSVSPPITKQKRKLRGDYAMPVGGQGEELVDGLGSLLLCAIIPMSYIPDQKNKQQLLEVSTLQSKATHSTQLVKRTGLPFMSSFLRRVMVAKKDVHMPKHPELADKNVPNLHVMKAMQSLKSRGFVKEQFAWRRFYWCLTNEGIQYLRDYLHLPPEIVPATLRRSRPETARPRPKGLEGERPARLTRGEADRDTYRRSAVPPGADKKAEVGAGSATEFQFRGGFGRGRGQPPQ
ncbi:hypothetical protein P7K49_035717 [Saguinus oedipus]|uniref:Small ribosomal subunit protein eS10 n=1 Tax=Saguinus oedipus TaxID=9490 RepID=A0ABQ9TND4_SAGOE|nr:hypothetical protein P7K49_035717 [Saguinus oedipus]